MLGGFLRIACGASSRRYTHQTVYYTSLFLAILTRYTGLVFIALLPTY